MWHKAFSVIEGEAFSPDKVQVNVELNHGGLNGIPINVSATYPRKKRN